MSVLYLISGAHRYQKRVSDPLELESQQVVNCLMWILGTELGSFAREVHALRLSHLTSPCSSSKVSVTFICDTGA